MEQATGLQPDALLAQQQAAAAAAAAAAAGAPAQFTFQPVMQQPYVLQSKPVVPGAAPGAQPMPQGAYAVPAVPAMMAVPGGYYQTAPAPAGSGSSGFPQLVGLPPGYSASGVPTSDAGTAAANAAAASGALAALLGTQGMPQVAAAPAPMPFPVHPGFVGAPLAVAVKPEPGEDRPSSSHSANTSAGGLGSDGSPHPGGSGGTPGSAGGNKSRYRGVSYDRKKAKWRVQIKVAALGKSGVSVGYFDTEEAAARAYDRAAIGLLGRDNPNLQTNFELADYSEEPIPRLTGKTREEVKTTLKSERIKQAPRRRFTSRQRTSRYMGVGSSNRKNQWQARILVHGKVTHLGYYETEEEAARVYDRVSLALHGPNAQTNFPAGEYGEGEVAPYRGLDREDLQRALGVKPMDKSSRFRGVSKKKGKWEAKVMVNRRWAYRELFDSEEEAARAYDRALWRLKPREARSYVNFKDEVPADAEALAAAAAAAGEDFRGVASDGDLPDAGGDGDDAGGFSDGGDFEYEYRPTKGTRRSASMRAKKAGSMPNLAAAAAAGGAGGGGISKAKQQQQQQQQAAAAAAAQQQQQEPAGPAFVPLPGGGLQLRFDANGVSSGNGFPGSVTADLEEPLLIRVGSETHVLPHGGGPSPAPSTLGKRTGLQRIQSEPQFGRQGSARRGSDPTPPDDSLITGVGAADISDLMHDRDLFRGLDLSELAGAMGEPPASAHGPGGGLDLSGLAMDFLGHDDAGMRDGSGGGGGLAGLLFEEDEELALANLEFSRPRKIPKSMSMSQLSALGGGEAEAPLAPPPQQMAPQGGALGRPPLPSRPGAAAALAAAEPLGPLGQPIRRINTFTASLPSFEEGEEKHHHGGVDLSGAEPAPDAGDDLASHLLGAAPPMSTLDDALHMLDGL